MQPAESRDWVAEVFPTAELARLTRLLPLGSWRRRAAKSVAARALDAALDARQAVLRSGRALDRAAEIPERELLVFGVYAPDGVADMAAAVSEIGASRHRTRFALGALGAAAPKLAQQTIAVEMRGGKFANLNWLAGEGGGAESADWVLIVDDDVVLPERFADRLISVAELLDFDLAQPAQTWSSDAAWRVTRRRPAMARRTRFVETGPVTLMSSEVFAAVYPFDEQGMGWGLDLHWAALAKRHGWSLGIVDALVMRHERRGTATTYGEADALEAARRFLETHEHLGFDEAQEVLARYRSIR
ncbi:MAG: hypothetical protein AABM29_04540 [Actinomycetota bacterium]